MVKTKILDKFVNREKQPELYSHSLRVGLISKDIGIYMDYSNAELEILEQAAVLHDVGKIFIPEEILYKKTLLSMEEWEVIKKHPLDGAKMVRHLYPDAVPAILFHHEKYSGNGYPRGISGEKIPLDAGIIAIADNFDSLRTEQRYRNARSPIEILSYIELESGRSFFPDIVKTFRRLLFDRLKFDGKNLWGL